MASVDPYRVQIATSASSAIRKLNEEEWAPVKSHLASIATLAARHSPPPKALLEEGGLSPPLFRFRTGEWLVLYDLSPVERTLTVLHVVRFSSDTPAASPPKAPNAIRRAV
jgi:hypothetical protein